LKLYLHDGGGLGDVIKHHIRGQRGWEYLKPLKEEHPDIEIKVMLTCINPQARELIRYNPYIDTIESYLWTHPARAHLRRIIEEHKGDYSPLLEATGLLRTLQPAVPEIYLNTEDQEIIDLITGQGKYIFIHPFSGEPSRIAFPSEQYPALIDRLIDELGYSVVVVGGTYKKNLTTHVVMSESLAYERDGLFNLVNKTNARVATILAQKAQGFIGTWSCYIIPSWQRPSKTVLMSPKGMRIMRLPDPALDIRISVDPKDPDYLGAINRTVEHFDDRPLAT
jgi:ADP-heptose:LPS heptosyltransferase